MSINMNCSEAFVRGTDKLVVVQTRGQNPADISLKQIAEVAAQKLPNYNPDNASAIVVLHTERKTYVLGDLKFNPAVDKTTPRQFSTSIGGKATDSTVSFRNAALNTLRTKMLLPQDKQGTLPEAEGHVSKLIDAINSDKGWEDQLCVHTDAWGPNEKDRMCVITGIKHIECSESDAKTLEADLKTITQAKIAASAPTWQLGNFELRELETTKSQALETYQEADEKTKLARFASRFIPIFNDLATATLANNGALASSRTIANVSLK